MRQLHRFTAHVLVFALAADPFVLAQAVRNADGVWARRQVATPFAAPATGPAGADEKAATCAESLTQRHAPLVSLAETLLWPPNHSLVDVGLDVNVTASCEGRVTTSVTVFADEPDDDQTGDGNVPGDARIDGTTLYLRSERKGDADGRVYLLLTTSTLPDGTAGTACSTVVVPRSRSRADLAGVQAQASAAQAYCEAHLAPPSSYFELAEGALTLANVPPVVNAGPDQAVDFPGPAVLQGTATDDGRPNGTLSVSWSQVDGPAGGAVTFSSPGTAETTAAFSATGTYTLRLTAYDGQLAESDDVVVVVAIANEAPRVDAGPDQEITLPEATVTLDGSATDDGRPAGSALTTTWSVQSPAGAAVTFADAQAAQTTATLPDAGRYVLRLTADDGQFAVSDDVQVTVHTQPPPVLDIEDAAVAEGHEGTTAAVVTLALSYAWSQPVTVDYLTEDGTAVAGCDYRTAFGTVTFAPGETTAEILVPIAGELVPEADETVRIRIDNVSQATLARTEATLTIANDDAANSPPGALSSRAPADRANGVALPPTLTWSAADPDAGDVLTHDVHLGTSFATSGQSWARTCPANQGPGPRTAPAAGYDEAGDRLILFGGTGTADDSLWILDNASAAGGPSQWTPIPTTGGPVGLGHAASAYDAATNRLFVVGGCSGDCLEGSDQTWVLANANGLGGAPTWSLLAGEGPGPRIDHAAAIDPASRRLIVFGGADAGAPLGDVWLLNLDGPPAWQELPAGGAGPARSGMSASYDRERNVLVVFGGRAGTQAFSDAWLLSNANGSGGGAQWTRLATAATAPPARWGHAAAYDPVTGRLVVYGGSTASANPASRFVFRDAWMLTGAAGAGSPEWIRLSPNAGPTGQVQAAGAFSASANRLIVVGGTSNTSAATDEVWVLSDAIGTLPLVSSDPATSLTADGLVPGAVYYWRIVSRDNHGAARGSTVWRFTSNGPPAVEAGPDQAITLPTSAVTLNGTGSDDGLPANVLTFAWAASGPGPVTFADASSAVTTATFAAPGTYVLRLTLSDSQLSASDELTVSVLAQAAAGRTWTTSADFAGGQALHVNGGGDQAQLDATAGAYPFVWIAVSSKGTIVKIDARTGAILGEYFSAPNGQPRNPSRTTVDLNGNVWTGNRDGNSIVHIGNEENGQCVDRNRNGVIDTSRGFGDLRPWTNAGGADTEGGISTAADECILHYTRVSAQGTRHLSVTKDNDVWVSGLSGASQPFDLVDGRTGFIKRSEPSVGFGGYGGLIDRNGVIWSARPLLRWDPALPLAGPNGGNWKGFGHDSYGLCIDPQGNVWETALFGPSTGNPATSGTLRKWAPDGTLLGTFGHGFARAQGCAVDARGDVWVAHALDGSNTVGHVKNNGAFVGNVVIPSGSTGVAVDLLGKVWTSNHNSRNVSRIDPNAGPIGADGVTRIGAVDFTTPDLGGIPYNYSDMTGSTLVGAPREGRWSAVFDSGLAGAKWGLIRWRASRCGDGALAVRVASSLDGLTFTADQPVGSGQVIPAPDGQYLRVTVTFTRATTGESPVLYDLSVGTEAYPVPGDDTDQPLQVDAGPDQSVETPNEASLSGSVCDEGRPADAPRVSWSRVSGPGDVRFSDPAQPKTRARFQAAGSFAAGEDFSETANPSGPWSYGWKPTRTGTFTAGVPSMYYGLPAWLRTRVPNFAGLPVIAKGPREQTYVFGSNVILPAEMLYLHPGAEGQNAVVRWTAPAAGSYRIEGRFQGITTGNATVDVAILHNTTSVFTGNITSFGQATPFAVVRNVAAGDVLDFSVGFGNGSFFNDSTGLAVRVVPAEAAGVGGTYVLRLAGSDAAGSAQDDVTVTVTTPDCVTSPAGTVGWWPADGHARDLLGGPAATLAGGIGYGAGMAGQAFVFDGFDDTVTIPASPALNVQAFTLEGWILPTDPQGERPIFEYGSPGVGVHLWQNLNTNHQRTPGALFGSVIDPNGSHHVVATGPGVLVPNSWNHVALAYDPASGRAKLYANGRLQVDFFVGQYAPKTNLPFNIGHRPNTSFRFAGAIDEATIVSRALTAAEIQEIYFAGSLGKCKAINQAPQVDAGADQEVLLPLKAATLAGTVSDDGLPRGVALKYQWTKVSGPGTVTFSAPASLSTSATFSTTGEYTLKLEADDSELKGSDSIDVSVRARADLAIPSVDVTGMSVDGQTLAVSGTIAATITNLGQGPAARPLTVTFFEDLNANGTLEASDTVLGSTSLASLDAGASSTVSSPVNGQVSFAGNSVHAFVDSTNAIVESDESNNYAQSGPPCENAAGTPRPFTAELEWSWSSSAVLPAATNVMSTPMVADLDSDGQPEVIFASYTSAGVNSSDGYLRVLDGATGAERFTVTNPAHQVAGVSTTAVGDIDGDGRPEIIALALSRDKLLAFEHDGSFKWQSPVLESTGWGGAALADLDGDGQPEILAGRTVLNNNGTVRWKGTGGKGETITNGFLVGALSLAADLDGNGFPEVVAGNTAYRHDGSILWQVPAPDGLTAVGNFDADSSPEIVLVGGGQLRLIEHDGVVKWGPVSLPGGGAGGAPVVADVDGDGVPEIGVAGVSRYTVFRADGTVKWAVQIQDIGSNVTGSSVFDFEGDGAAEVVYSDEISLRVFRGTDGAILFERPLGSCTAFENPVIADVDADGRAEIIAIANRCGTRQNNGILVFGNADWVSTRRIWNQHTYHITNVNDDGTIPPRETNSWTKYNSYRQNRLTSGCEYAKPDLTASYVRKEESGGSLILTARIGNGGGSTVAAGVSVSFYDRDPATVGAQIANVATPSALAPGRFVDVSVTVPATTVARPLWVVADDQGGLVGTIDELDETNNSYNSRQFLSPTSNTAPTVEAGLDQRLVYPEKTAFLDGTATDDGLPLGELATQWSVLQRPAGATVTFSDSTAVDSTATFSAVGTYVLRLTGDDGQATGSDDVTIVVEAANQAPSVDAGPNQSITQPTAALDGTVTDDGLPTSSVVTVQWSKLQGPGTAAFANASAADTTVTFDQEGHYVLRLSASDSAAEGSDTVEIDVAFANAAPVVDAGPDRTLTLPANSLTLTGTANDDGLPLGSTLSIQWGAVVSPGVVTFSAPTALETTATFSDPGVYVLKLTASDGTANANDQVQVTVNSAAPVGLAPTVAITSPAEGATVVERVEIVGSAESSTLASWRLEHRLTNDSTWTRFASGTEPLSGGVLAVFDPTLLLNGIYEVRLVATDISGRSTSTSFTAVVKGEQKVGLFTLSFVDLEVPVSGLPIRVIRSYDSRDKRKGDFGVGWRMDLSSVTVQESGVAGLHWDGTKSSGPFPNYCLEPARPHTVTFTLSDGRVQEFEVALEPSCQPFAPPEVVRVTFRAAEGTVGSLAPMSGDEVWAVGSWPGPMDLYDGDTFEIYDPELYRYTSPEGDVFIVHESGGLQSLTDANGNRLIVTAAGIQHSSGKSISFVRDVLGRVTSITDPAGNAMTYQYDGRGDLVAFTDRESQTTRFTYNDSHGLVDIEDPRGVRVARNEYDAQGRLVRYIDSFGKVIKFSHDIGARRQVITDRLGNTRLLEYDPRGNLVREVDAQGGVTLRTYDSRDNTLSETDPNGNTTTFTYDAQDNLLTERDALGNTINRTYNARRQVLTLTDARGRATTNTYDANNNLLKTRDALGQETTYTYDGAGNMLTRTDPLGCITRFEYDSSGNLTKETNALGHATSYTYNANGNRLSETKTRTVAGVTETLRTTFDYDKLNRLIQTTYPDGSTLKPSYDAMGRRVATIDRLGRETRSEFDEMGRLIRLRFPGALTQEYGHDDEGRVVSERDRAGRLTSYAYNALGKLLTITTPDSASRTDTYDAGGRLTATTDATGATTRYEYDVAGRQTKVVDPLGHVAEKSYDANGNLTAIKDPNGLTTTYEYDDLNRRVRTVFPDGTEERIAYDPLGRITSRTDQAGQTTQFAYDCLGQLLRVIDALGQVTSHSYDEIGDRVSQTDASGRTTIFEYDRMRHPRRRALPDGASETMTFDSEGNLVARTDFMGRSISYTYDTYNRLTERRYPDGTRVTFTYTPMGKRASATDTRGTTVYSYDVRDRMISAVEPDGRKLEYAYDGEGRRTRLTATVGADALVTNYSYDVAGRLVTVTDPLGRAYTHDYDANGNRVSLAQPNGTATTYSYNALNRLSSLTTTHSGSGRMIQSYVFTLGPTGNRERITEHDGTVREYAYDELYRLTRETIRTALGVLSDDSFRYDPVGNRLERMRTDASGTVTTLSSYDKRDRLLSAGERTFGWDDNGNLVSRSGATTYVWDFDQRLREVRSADGTVVEEAYDADGNRVEVNVTPPTGPPTLTRYLVDMTCTLCQTVAESNTAGQLTAYYVRGNDLLSLMRPDGAGGFTTRYYHADGLGSVRRLTDEAGNLTDGYTYSAFGELIAHTGSDPQPFAFAGEAYDPNIAFYQNRARWLDPEAGRFVSPDPVLGKTSDPQSLHQYTYAHLDPVNRTDPSGLTTQAETINAAQVNNTLNTIVRPRFEQYLPRILERVVCKGSVKQLEKMLEAHHPIPKFLGGAEKQKLVDLSIPLHNSFHRALNDVFKILGMPGGKGGKFGSAEYWEFFYKMNPGSETELVALAAVLGAAELIDKKCKLNGKLRNAVLENLDNFVGFRNP